MAIEILEAPQAISTTVLPTYGVSRRRLLQTVGGACVVLVAGTLYRAYDQGVFNTGQGSAYDAWREWDTEAGGVSLALVRAAVLATNAHNTQPWLFHVSSDRIDLYAALDRNIGTIDSLRRLAYFPSSLLPRGPASWCRSCTEAYRLPGCPRLEARTW